MHCSMRIRKLLAADGNEHKDSQFVSVQRIRDFEAQPSMGCLYHTSPLKIQGGGAERIKSQISRKLFSTTGQMHI